jgi:hypothetical protein
MLFRHGDAIEIDEVVVVPGEPRVVVTRVLWHAEGAPRQKAATIPSTSATSAMLDSRPIAASASCDSLCTPGLPASLIA